jgi:hypothetical protein
MKNKGCLYQGCSAGLWILVYLFIFVLAISGLGFYGLSIGIIGAVLAYTSPTYRNWLKNQRGFQFRLSKLPGMASSSPTALALTTLAYTVPLSLISWSFLLGSFGKIDTTITAAIMGLVGLVLLFGWSIQGWGIKSTVSTQQEQSVTIENKSDNSRLSQDGIVNYFRQNPIASIAIPIALILPLCCGLVGTWVSPIVITPTPTPTPITPTPTKLPPTATLTPSETPIPTATLIPSETPISQATSTPLETATFILESTSTLAPTNTASASDFTILVLTSPVRAGSSATVRIQTVAGASCFLSYTTPSGTDSQAAGLGATTADTKGVCSWTWNIGPKTKAGTGSLAITANGSTQYLSIVIQ